MMFSSFFNDVETKSVEEQKETIENCLPLEPYVNFSDIRKFISRRDNLFSHHINEFGNNIALKLDTPIIASYLGGAVLLNQNKDPSHLQNGMFVEFYKIVSCEDALKLNDKFLNLAYDCVEYDLNLSCKSLSRGLLDDINGSSGFAYSILFETENQNPTHQIKLYIMDENSFKQYSKN